MNNDVLYLPPSSRDDSTSEYDSIRKCRTSQYTIDQQTNFSERPVSKCEAIWKVTEELIRYIEILEDIYQEFA